jgi:hypothetical protein
MVKLMNKKQGHTRAKKREMKFTGCEALNDALRIEEVEDSQLKARGYRDEANRGGGQTHRRKASR